MFVIRRPASFVVSGIVGLLSLVVAVAQFTFGAPQSFYAVGAMTLAVAALVLILSFVGIIVSPRS
jgi:FtsH-binding integral membrane protein